MKGFRGIAATGVALVVASALTAPVYLLLALIQDRLFGNGELSFELLYSRKQMLAWVMEYVVPQFGYVMLFSILVLVLINRISAKIAHYPVSVHVLAAFVAGAVTGLVLLGGHLSGILIFALTGAIIGFIFQAACMVLQRPAQGDAS